MNHIALDLNDAFRALWRTSDTRQRGRDPRPDDPANHGAFSNCHGRLLSRSPSESQQLVAIREVEWS